MHDDHHLWPGASDPTSSRYVPIEVRDIVMRCPDDITAIFVREGHDDWPDGYNVIVDHQLVVIHPGDDPGDHETYVVHRKVQWALTVLRSPSGLYRLDPALLEALLARRARRQPGESENGDR